MARVARRAACINARRMPLIPHQLSGWLDVDRGLVMSGTAVTGWNDRMGTFNFAQATGSKQPTWTNSGHLGVRGIQFDGSDDVLTYAASPFDAGTTAYVVLILGAGSQTKYVWSNPDVAAGNNGLDLQLAGNFINVDVKTDTALSTTNLAASYSSQGRIVFEVYVNLANTPDVTVITDDALLGTTNAGTVLDQDSGQMVLGAFSDGGFSSFAAATINVFLVLKRPMSIGERRRLRRWARRRHQAGPPMGDWTDATVSEVI